MSNTLTITFAETSPAPQSGYRVIYWPTTSPLNKVTISPNPTSSPVVITGLNETSYTGTVEAGCGGGSYSSPVSFTGTAAPTSNPGGAASLSVGIPCSNGFGNYTLTGAVGDVVRVRLFVSGLLTPTSTSWLSATMGSSNPSFSVVGTSACYQPGSSQGVSLELFKNITIPVGGSVTLNTAIITNNSVSSMISASLRIMTVNGGTNTSTGTTILNSVCVGNSGGGSCPGATYIGD